MFGDYGIYGKGYEGYAHYMQAFEESKKNSGGSGPPPGGKPGCGTYIILGIIIFVLISVLMNDH